MGTVRLHEGSCWKPLIVAAGLILLGGGTAFAADAHSSRTYAGADACAACHPTEYEEWKTSKHAGAFSPTFSAYWKEHGSQAECLACHTTGFDPQQRTFAFAGVSCESCHGPLAPDHPTHPTMQLPMDSSLCASCHKQTYLEWQLSVHAKKHIRCFDCHAVHRQGLRRPEVEQQCGACHAQRLDDFAHATHHMQGLTCKTCHMAEPRNPGIGGTGAPAHTFFVGAETCAACHEETVHKSHRLSSTLTQQVERLIQKEDIRQAEDLQAKIRALELERDIQRTRIMHWALGALLAGLLLGVLLAGVHRERNGRSNGPAP